MKRATCLALGAFALPLVALATASPVPTFTEGAHPLPPSTLRTVEAGVDFYPAVARRGRIEGETLVAFSITARGTPTKLRVLDSNHRIFSSKAKQFVRQLRFAVPQDWSESTDTWRRYRLRTRFLMHDCDAQPSTLPEQDEVAHSAVVICAQGLGR